MHFRPYNYYSVPNKKKKMLTDDVNKDGRSTTKKTEVDWLNMN